MEDKKYPIYNFSAKWSEIKKDRTYSEKETKDLPDNQFWNSTSFKKMFKEEQTQEQLDIFIKNWWKKYAEFKKLDYVSNIILTSTFYEFESWVCTWFEHETFDVGQTDQEALDSFEQFVRRYENMQFKIPFPDPLPKNYHCLMGAEDRWRWHGAKEDGSPDPESSPPCRCKFCKKQGVIRIGH